MTKNEIKYLKSLLKKKNRLEDRHFVIDGLRIVEELLNSSHPFDKIWVSSDFLLENKTFADRVADFDCEIIESSTFSKVLKMPCPQEIMSLVPIIPNHISKYNSHLLILDEISDPGNMGTILRTAAWFGVNQIICSPNCVDVYNPKTVRSAMGAHFYLHIYTHSDFNNYLEAIKKIKNSGTCVIGADIRGVPYKEFTLQGPGWAMILGSEANGINPEVEPLVNETISIPQNGRIESLNVGVAAAILMDRLINQ